MVKFQISIDAASYKALRSLAESEFRDPRAQVALIIRRELERSGLLIAEVEPNQLASGELAAERKAI